MNKPINTPVNEQIYTYTQTYTYTLNLHIHIHIYSACMCLVNYSSIWHNKEQVQGSVRAYEDKPSFGAFWAHVAVEAAGAVTATAGFPVPRDFNGRLKGVGIKHIRPCFCALGECFLNGSSMVYTTTFF